ncbi:MAG: hypothetical protein A2136_07965 [Chloroflexi bacterium RBG_16_54_11]|nr:MAG: hypothetical protein A2136_07965 [Chloroflexi bacterium RBG_16_54_11]
MTDQEQPTPSVDLERIVESARRLGIELDEAEALQWMTALASLSSAMDISIDAGSGVFGNKIVMLDFSPAELAYFREVGRLVEFHDQPGIVETALALSGSSAQSKIQTYPGDCDYFERVNIKASTRQEACRILAEIMRDKALSTLKGPTYQLIEVKFGNYPFDATRGERSMRAGAPISWAPQDIQNGKFDVRLPEGSAASITWEPASADPAHGRLSNASNMLDVTWEAPDETITPLDGYLDPYFQEVYLEAESIPIFSKLAKHVSADALDEYVKQLEHEVNKYLTKDVNYGKVAKRLYNIFRLTGRYEDAAFLRDLFDEPTTMLYQVWSLIRTMDDAFGPGSGISLEQLLSQSDQLILAVIRVLEGDQEAEIVRLLLRLRDALSQQDQAQGLNAAAEATRAEVINLVNNFFFDKLTAIPTIKAYMDGIKGTP